MEKSRPYVILSAAISVDGRLATRKGDSSLSSKKDLVRIHKLRSTVDAILIGKNTLLIDNPTLNVRHARGKNPVRIILNPSGDIEPNSKIVKTCRIIPTIIAVTDKISKHQCKKLQNYGLQVIKCGHKTIYLQKLLKALKDKKIKRLLVEGGGVTNWSFIEENLVDEIVVTVSPYIIGGIKAVSLVEGIGFDKVKNSLNLKLKNIKIQGNEVILRYLV